jgi:hypothetical protein
MIESMQALFGAMVDYAGMFPPASLALDAAVADYARIKASADAWLVGRFVISAGRLRDFERLAPRVLDRDDEPWVLSVLLPADTASSLSEITHSTSSGWGGLASRRSRLHPLPIETWVPSLAWFRLAWRFSSRRRSTPILKAGSMP